ncbi:MAG: hypothetical protein EOM12_12920 [Verrucomicrobiae bacterium]|nr:hypothetical protein [Verrucomicrobiae bacterium]
MGISRNLLVEIFGDVDQRKALPPKQKEKLDDLNEIWDLSEDIQWFENPGGIPQVVLSKLPVFILIPAECSSSEISAKNGTLAKTLKILFEDVRARSTNYQQAQRFLNLLSAELDPEDEDSDFGRMMRELNEVLDGVFPQSRFSASANLSDPDSALSPTFDIRMSSNVSTEIEHQGTGMIRSAIFALLRYCQTWTQQREEQENRGLIIGFEEPEIYLHPSAANQMRDTIYQLASGSSQIVASTHSPYMIDLSRKPRQILNRFRCEDKETEIIPFNVTQAFLDLQEDDKKHVKMILKVDDYVARAFFTNKVVIVEGDTEDLVIKEAIKLLSDKERLAIKSNVEVVKARGKGAIIGLVQYLKALSINVFVIHDRDAGTPRAEAMNAPILNTVGDANKIEVLHECLEDVLGYSSPLNEKPYNAFIKIQHWSTWEDVPPRFRDVLKKAFGEFMSDAASVS